MHRVRLLLIAAVLITTGICQAQTATGETLMLDLPRASQHAQIVQRIGITDITINYHRPLANGRQIWGKVVPYDRVWRAGANNATVLHTEGDLDIGGLAVPKGDYSLFVNLADLNAWELIINKQTGQGGLDYDASKDLGRVKMTMGKAPKLVEQLKYTLSNAGGNKGRLQLAWENVTATVNITVK